ncbi:MAG TPA: glycosyltransferase family 2 protein [Terriglobia bacterium]|nr:glycosyltransferase family 2 protein [Terriglobia bacterium]
MSGNSQARVSILIPARNEEANIERAVRSVASQSGVPLEVIVVDDQSEDGTSKILERLKREFPSLRILRIDALPDGWLGKPYALARGAETASGAWLLFTDADTVHHPGSLAELLERAENEHVDLLSLSPGQLTPTWWEKSVIPWVYVWLAKHYSFDEVNDPHSKAAAANGQYLLIRRAAYDRVGGHQAVQGEILEDVALAERVKSSGGRILFMPGAKWVETRMYRTFSAMWEGWTKNLYLLYGGNVKKILGTVATIALVDLLPVACLFLAVFIPRITGDAAMLTGLYCVVLASIFILRFALYRRRLRELDFSPDLAVYYWLGSALMGALLVNSLRVHRWGGHIQWKGRAYSTKGAAG